MSEVESADQSTAEALSWLESQKDQMVQKIIDLCNQNSGTFHVQGVEKVVQSLKLEYEGLADSVQQHPTPPAVNINEKGKHTQAPLGPNLQIGKRVDKENKVFLCIHTDTVFAPDHPFQECRWLDETTLNGPGVIDAKGGQVVMLYALSAFEKTEWAKQIGWRVFINPDEEIGSLGSAPILRELASDCQMGMLFEPALPDGSMVAGRKGAGNFTIICRGVGAHSGRDFEKGRNAIVRLASVIAKIDELNQSSGLDATFNVGRVSGGGAVNMVPDLAIARINVRVLDNETKDNAYRLIEKIVQAANEKDYSLELHGEFSSPPKPVDNGTRQIQARTDAASKILGVPVSWRNTGGASDGNKLAGIGVPNIDTFGPCGDNLHNDREYLKVDSLVPRTKLAVQVLIDFAKEISKKN